MNWKTVAKSIGAGVLGFLGALYVASTDNNASLHELIGCLQSAALMAAGVWAIPNAKAQE